jgi:hypothetical protein
MLGLVQLSLLSSLRAGQEEEDSFPLQKNPRSSRGGILPGEAREEKTTGVMPQVMIPSSWSSI